MYVSVNPNTPNNPSDYYLVVTGYQSVVDRDLTGAHPARWETYEAAQRYRDSLNGGVR